MYLLTAVVLLIVDQSVFTFFTFVMTGLLS